MLPYEKDVYHRKHRITFDTTLGRRTHSCKDANRCPRRRCARDRPPEYEPLLKISDVQNLLLLSKPKIYQLMHRNGLPQ